MKLNNYFQVSLLSSSVVLSSSYISGTLYLATVLKDDNRFIFIVDIKDEKKIQKQQVYTKIKEEFVSTSIVVNSDEIEMFDVNVLYADGSLTNYLSAKAVNLCQIW